MRYFTLLALAFVLLTSCASPPSLSNAYPSPEALAGEVLVALTRGDRARLRALALIEEEFRGLVWSALPAARPGRNVPFSYVWGDLRQKSEASLAALITSYGGRRFELMGVSFDGPTTDYGRYEVRRQAAFWVRGPNGPVEITVCGSLIQTEGQWKIFSYVVND